MDAAHTGYEGDGIVAVLPVDDVYLIRTKEKYQDEVCKWLLLGVYGVANKVTSRMLMDSFVYTVEHKREGYNEKSIYRCYRFGSLSVLNVAINSTHEYFCG